MIKNDPFRITYFEIQENDLLVRLESNHDNSIYYYYESFGSVDVRDVKGEFVSPVTFDMIVNFIDKSEKLVEYANESL